MKYTNGRRCSIAQLHDRIGRVGPHLSSETSRLWTLKSLIISDCCAVNFMLTRYASSENISRPRKRSLSITKGQNTDPFDFWEAVWARVAWLRRAYSDEDLNSLFVEVLIPSIKRNVRSYWSDNPLSDIYFLVNYALSRMPLTDPDEVP